MLRGRLGAFGAGSSGGVGEEVNFGVLGVCCNFIFALDYRCFFKSFERSSNIFFFN